MKAPLSECCEAPIDEDGCCMMCGQCPYDDDIEHVDEPIIDDIRETGYEGDAD